MCYIKKCETDRLPNGDFEDINKAILKKSLLLLKLHQN